MLTLGASLVSWASWVSSWARLVVVLLFLSFSSRSSRWFRVVWKNCFRVGCCYGNGSSSGLPRRGRPLSFEQARGATRRRFTHTHAREPSFVAKCVAWCCLMGWCNVGDSSQRIQHTRTDLLDVLRSIGRDPALLPVSPRECLFRNVLLSERKRRSQFCLLCVRLYAKLFLVRTIYDLFFF